MNNIITLLGRVADEFDVDFIFFKNNIPYSVTKTNKNAIRNGLIYLVHYLDLVDHVTNNIITVPLFQAH